ncbi:Ig-like domain-containing protein [Streptomyces sp. NPDC058442]|uniref:L,D-transpeptidase n=1 Tax=Streptomyces sp. NPDC058442 TaxID=3346503 RepID=UPI0036612FEB
MRRDPHHRTVVGRTLLVIALGAGVAGCSAVGDPLSAEPYDAADQISFNGPTAEGGTADPDTPLEVVAEDSDGRITDVTAVDTKGRHMAGELAADGSRWHSTSPLVAGASYTIRVSTESVDGAPGRKVLALTTGKPASKSLGVAFGPEAGTYGVGQPLTAELTEPVKDPAQRAVVERGLKVSSTPSAGGAWHWVDDKKLHFRPKDYWPENATVRVRSTLEGVRINDRLRGGRSEPLTIRTGDRVVAVTDVASHRLTVYKGDKQIRTIPVTAGKPGFETRNGIKVVLGKERTVQMRSSSIGIAEGSAESYDMPVHFAARMTWSGEYVHAAPWSVGSQGYANVSHGCVGMSTGEAEWFYDTVRRGDLITVVNSNGADMEPFGNGFGDWNLDWTDWRAGSALTGGSAAGSAPEETARLRPQPA